MTILLTIESTLVAPPRATLQFLIEHVAPRMQGNNYNQDDVGGVILPAYWQTCTSVGIDPVLAVVQMMLETGNLSSWWAARPQRNPAGIGVNGDISKSDPHSTAWAKHGDVWEKGLSFKSWAKDAIPAHVGRLLAYALKDKDATAEQLALIKHALALRPLSDDLRGAVPTLRQLHGTWAEPKPPVNYAVSLVRRAKDFGLG